MSDNIPLHIQEKIIKSLPVKSLIQFRSVSKTWKSMIDSKEFIADYHIQEQQQQHCLFVRYVDSKDYNWEEKYVSILDDKSFPQHKLTLNVPMPAKLLKNPTIFSSQGLFCWYCAFEFQGISESHTAVIWNPAIQKSVSINDMPVLSPCMKTSIGFGVCPETWDPMLLRVAFDRSRGENQRDPIVEVFRLSTGVWRSLSINLPRKSLVFTNNQVAIGRFIYWRAYEKREAGLKWYHMIMSFDMTSDEFTEIHLPDNLLDPKSNFSIYKLRKSLVVVQSKGEAGKLVYRVWKMIEHGAQKAFIELFIINPPDASIEYFHGFRTSGEPIVEERIVLEDDALFVYEPNSKKLTYAGITAKQDIGVYLKVIPYVETLLLLDY